MDPQLNPAQILQVGSGFWASKVLLTAVEFELFTLLADRSRTAGEIEDSLELRSRATADFLDALVALRFLDRVTLSTTRVRISVDGAKRPASHVSRRCHSRARRVPESRTNSRETGENE